MIAAQRSVAVAKSIARCARVAIGLAISIAPTGIAQQSRAGRVVFDTVHSVALAHNKFGDPASREIAVYLPPSYATNTTARYPVVYLLHGYGGSDRTWLAGALNGFAIQPSMDSLVNAGTVREMIIVMPSGGNRLAGSFYTNSATNGNWDDFIAKELVAYVDGKYRTLARVESRGLAGHSMGGFGTFYLGMRHGGDVYGAAYALSGCCTYVLGSGMTPAQAAGWKRVFAATSLSDFRGLPFFAQVDLALAAAFSPDSQKPPFYADFPVEEKGGAFVRVDSVAREWAAHSPLDMLTIDPHSAANLKRLRGFAFDVGAQDPLVPPAQMYAMDSALTRAGVPHSFETYPGDHTNQIGSRIITKVLPFFSQTLDFTTARRGSARHTFR